MAELVGFIFFIIIKIDYNMKLLSPVQVALEQPLFQFRSKKILIFLF